MLGDAFVVPMKNANQYMSKDNITLAFDYINIDKGFKDNIRFDFSLKIRKVIFQTYKQFMPSLIIIGLLAFITSAFLAFKKSQYSIIFAITSACWISIATRSAVLVLVDISSFPAITVEYLQPIFAFSLIASILSIGLLVNYLRSDIILDKKLFKLLPLGAK